jgi:hypothetical protein
MAPHRTWSDQITDEIYALDRSVNPQDDEVHQLRQWKVRVEVLLVRLKDVAEKTDAARTQLAGQVEGLTVELDRERRTSAPGLTRTSVAQFLAEHEKLSTHLLADNLALDVNNSAAPSSKKAETDALIAKYLAEQATLSQTVLDRDGALAQVRAKCRRPCSMGRAGGL